MNFTQQDIDVAMVVCALIAFAFGWSLINLKDERSHFWKASVLMGMAGVGGGALIRFSPEGRPYAMLSVVAGMMIMLAGVYLTNYLATSPTRSVSIKSTSIRGLAFNLLVIAAVTYPISLYIKQRGSADEAVVVTLWQFARSLEESNARTQREFAAMNRRISTMDSVNAARDSVRRGQAKTLLDGQRTIMQRQTEVKEDLRQSRRRPPYVNPNTVYLPPPRKFQYIPQGYEDND